jgi:hypothetical protein
MPLCANSRATPLTEPASSIDHDHDCQLRCHIRVQRQIFAELARKAGKPSRLMIDATHLKAHRTAASLLKKGLFPDVSGARRAA